MLVLLVWMMSSIEPRFHHRRAVRPAIKLTRARYPVWYHHVLNAAVVMTELTWKTRFLSSRIRIYAYITSATYKNIEIHRPRRPSTSVTYKNRDTSTAET